MAEITTEHRKPVDPEVLRVTGVLYDLAQEQLKWEKRRNRAFWRDLERFSYRLAIAKAIVGGEHD